MLQDVADLLEKPVCRAQWPQSPLSAPNSHQQNILGAVANGVQRVIHNTEGLCEEDRHWVQRQGSNISALASGGINILRQSGPLVNFLERHLGQNWQSQQSGLDVGVISKWLDERQIPADSVSPGSGCPLGLKPNESWTCSICLAGCEVALEHQGTADQEICLLCDSDGHSWHVFHKLCAKEWLQRSATCPLCRRDLHIS
eukprot:g21248.t1